MPSQRHTPRTAARDSTDDAVLAAARESVLAVGVRRTTLTDVARRAGVSRMTVYRRFPDVTALIAALMTREFGPLLLAPGSTAPTARERIVADTVATVQALAGHELFRRVLDVEPELLLPYVVDRLGETQLAARSLLAARIRDGQRDGSVRLGRPVLLAHSVLLAVSGFVLGARADLGGVPRTGLARELVPLLDGYLRPGP